MRSVRGTRKNSGIEPRRDDARHRDATHGWTDVPPHHAAASAHADHHHQLADPGWLQGRTGRDGIWRGGRVGQAAVCLEPRRFARPAGASRQGRNPRTLDQFASGGQVRARRPRRSGGKLSVTPAHRAWRLHRRHRSDQGRAHATARGFAGHFDRAAHPADFFQDVCRPLE